MWLLRYPHALEIAASDRDRTLVWLFNNHPNLDCRLDDDGDGGLILCVGEKDAGLLDQLADLLANA